MQSGRTPCVVVVADDACGRAIGVALERMALSRVSVVQSLEEAGQACTTGHADACVVVQRNAVFLEFPFCDVEPDAPGRGSGVPSLLVADVVTPYIRRTARRAGYAGVLPLDADPRLLYRGLRGLLQKLRRPIRLARGRGGQAEDPAVARLEAFWAGVAFDPSKRKLS